MVEDIATGQEGLRHGSAATRPSEVALALWRLGWGGSDSHFLRGVFNIYNQPGASHSHYNILSKIDFAPTVAKGNYTLYYTSPQDTWPLISYKHYNNIKMYTLLGNHDISYKNTLKVNGILESFTNGSSLETSNVKNLF